MKIIKLNNITDIGTIINMTSRMMILFDANWLKNSPSVEAQRNKLYNYLSYEIDVLYILLSDGNDSIEDFIINVINSKRLPVLIGINNRSINMTYELNDISEDSINYYKNLNLKIQNFKASMSVEENNKDIIKSLFDNTLTYDIPMVENNMAIGKVFISGDRSSVGKSTTCLAILSSLLKLGVKPQDLAYIKPVTQCEALQPVTEFCQHHGIANRAIGPVVFYKGFTRAFLAGETEPVESLLNSVRVAVDEISVGKKLTIIDGVGYPSVGSICSISNADVARYLNVPVLLIGKSGVGDAIDSYNLNSRFFEAIGVTVLGGIFNKFQLGGFYSLESCRESINQYFRLYKNYQKAYGFMPMLELGEESNNNDEMISSVFMNYVDIKNIIIDIWNYNLDTLVVDEIISQEVPHHASRNPAISISSSTVRNSKSVPSEVSRTPTATYRPVSNNMILKKNDISPKVESNLPLKRSREDIEKNALNAGAKGG